jgi:TRAP-type C4-dicarboxylate transport system substrate-binding protein
MKSRISRRTFISSTAAGTSFASFALLPRRSKAAEFEYKIGNDVPDTHPMNVRLKKAIAKIEQETSGRLVFKLFPNNQLGGDTDSSPSFARALSNASTCPA